MNHVKTTVWDPAEYIETEEDAAVYLDEIFKMGDPDLIVTAIGDVVRARGMAKTAGDNPSFETIVKVLASLGFELRLAAAA